MTRLKNILSRLLLHSSMVLILIPTFIGAFAAAGPIPQATARVTECFGVDGADVSELNGLSSEELEAELSNPQVAGDRDIVSCIQKILDDRVNEQQQGDQEEARASDTLEEQKRILKAANTIEKARKLFSQGRNNELTDDNFDDVQRDFVGHYDDGNDGFKPRPNTAPQLKKFEGNPWFQWSDESGNLTGAYRVPEGGSGAAVRFVLSEVNTRSNESGVEGAVTGDRAGTAWIFRNEYNPSIAVVIWQRDAVDGSFLAGVTGVVAGSASNWRRLVFASDCESVTGNENDVRMANVSDPHDFNAGKWLGDDPGSDTVKNQIEKYKLTGSTCNTTTGFFQDAIKKVMELIANALSALLKTIVGWVDGIVNIGALSNNPGLTSAWKTIRDFVNIIFILILVVIAFSNILRIDTDRYGARALLPRLLFAVVAVNFSFIMVQILTNAAYILSQPFLSRATELITNPPADSSLIEPTGGFGNWIVAVLLFIGVIVGLLILLLFFVVRILMIWMLTATSPFVFLFMILPFTRSIASSWYQNALKWIFMPPIAFVLLFIAAELISGGGDLARAPEHGDIADPSFLLKIGFFIGACIAAVMIPLKLGGEIMGRAASAGRRAGRTGIGAGKFGGGAVARKTGLAAANQQRKERAERKQALRGAGIRAGFNKRLATATGGRLGGEAGAEAEAQMSTAKEKEAELYANQFNDEDLTKMQKRFKPGSRMHETLGLAKDIRSGAFAERRKGEQLANEASNFSKKPIEAQRREIQDLGSRNVTQFSPSVLEDLATTQDTERASLLHDHLSSGALEGALDQNSPARIEALRQAHANGRINREAFDAMSQDKQDLYRKRIGDFPDSTGGSSGGGRGTGGPTGGSGGTGPERVDIPGPNGGTGWRRAPNTEGRANPSERRSSGGVILPPGVEED